MSAHKLVPRPSSQCTLACMAKTLSFLKIEATLSTHFFNIFRKTISLSEYENLKKEKAKREEELRVKAEEQRKLQEEEVSPVKEC